MSENHSDGAHSEEADRKVQKRLIIGSVAISLIVIAGVLVALKPQWYQNYAPKQPIPFSHKVHAGQYSIPCLYCHGSAEHSEFAAVPGLETCMNCHSVVKTDSPHIQKVREHFEAKKPIQWVKVHVLPDFVHFNHKRHVAAGVECQTCHGPVEKMDKVYQFAGLNMGWCTDCHRNNDYLTPHRIEWGEKEKAMGGTASSSPIGQWGKDGAPFWYKALSHPLPHNADVSCTTCHY